MYTIVVVYRQYPGLTRVYGPYETKGKAVTAANDLQWEELCKKYPQGDVFVRKVRKPRKAKNDL